MAESELGVAVLRISVDSREALAGLEVIRSRFISELGDLGEINFRGVERTAADAGQRAGRAIREGITAATANLRFDSIREALDFSGALNGTLRDLRQYREALVALREVTPATAQGFAQLNDVIEASSQAIRNYSAGTDQLQDSARRINLRELNAQIREQRQEVAANARLDRQWADAIRTIESAQRGAATATRVANQAFRDQIGLVGTLAQRGARDIARTVGGVSKGVAAAAKGAVNIGKFGYELGAEFGVFEAPRTGPIKQAISQVAERFEFLGKQAQTTRGIILRAIEAAGTSAGLVELARNADLLKAALGGVDGAAQVASKGLNVLDKVGGGFFDFLSKRFPDTAFGEFARLASGATDVAAGIGSATSSLTGFASQGVAASLDSLQALISALGNVPPEAQAAVLALAGLSIGFKEKPIVEGLTRVLEYLDGLSNKALKVRSDLGTVFQELGQFQDKLSQANGQKLLPSFRERGLDQLDDSVRQSESLQRITAAIGSNWERGARFLEKSTAEIKRQVELGIRQGPSTIFASAGTAAVANAQQYARPIGPVAAPPPALGPEQQLLNRRNQLLDDLADVTGRRVATEQALLSLQEASRKIEQRNLARQTEIQRLRDATAVSTGRASPIDGSLGVGASGQERFIPGSPGARRDAARRRSDAIGSGLIGGAFPLLFGQGLGASIGGGLGGAGGGLLGGQFGFGLSLVGTALGAQFDTALQSATLLAKGLDDPIASFQELQQQALISSKSMEKLIKGLIDTGRGAEAQALIQKDLLTTFGSQQGATEYKNAVDSLNRAWQQGSAILGSFIAGPLADLIKRLKEPQGNLSTAVRFEQLAGQLTPDQLQRVRAVTEAAANRSAQNRGGVLGAFNRVAPNGLRVISENDLGAGRRAGIAEAERILGVDKQRADAAARVLAAQLQSQRSLSTSYKLIDAQVQGYERQTLELQKQQALEERNRKLLELAPDRRVGTPEARKIQQDTALEVYRITQQITELDQKRWADGIAAANRIAQIQRETAITSLQRDVGGPGLQALQALEQLRRAREAEQEAQAQLRVRPGDPALLDAANQAAEQTKAAAEQTRQTLVDAYTQAKDAARQIGRSIEDAAQALIRLQNGGDGLNAFLTGEARQVQQQQAFRALLPQFEQNRQQAASLFRSRGNEAAAQQFERLNFSGTIEQVNSQMLAFESALRNQIRAEQDYQRLLPEGVRATNAANTAETALRAAGLTPEDTVPQLISNLTNLVNKKWDVIVNVAANGQAAVYGDAVNAGF